MNAPVASLPPPLVRLPEIIGHLDHLKSGSVLETDLTDTRAATFPYATVDSSQRLPSSTTAYATTSRAMPQHNLPRFYLSVDESNHDLPSGAGLVDASSEFRQPPVDKTPLSPPVQRPTAVRPRTIRTPAGTPGEKQPSPAWPSPKKVSTPLQRDVEEVDDRVPLKDLLKSPAFMQTDVDYDDPYNDEAFDSVSKRF